MEQNQRKKELLRAYKERPLSGGVSVITNTVTGRKLLKCEVDLKGSQNRFDFFQMTDCAPQGTMVDDWKQYGAKAFDFTILEELTQKDNQTAEEFREELNLLGEIWKEKMQGQALY